MFRALLPKPFHINIDESCILKGSLYYPPLFSSSHPIYSTPSLSDTAGVGNVLRNPKILLTFCVFICVSIFNSICDHKFPTINSTFYFLVCCSLDRTLLLFSSNAMKPFFAVRSGFHGILPKFLLKAFCKRYQGSCQNMALMRSVTSKGVFFC